MERIAELAHMPVGEVEQALRSQTGRQTLEQLKQAQSTMSFELLSATKLEISGALAYEIHSKLTILQSGQTILCRQFSYEGVGPKEIVTITYAGSTEDIFQDKALFGFIKRPTKGQVVATNTIQNFQKSVRLKQAIKIDRKTFSLLLPDNWTENKKDDMYEPESFIFFEGPESCFFNVVIGKKSAGASIDALVNRQRDGMLKKFTDATVTPITIWSSFKGKGFEIDGKIQGIISARVRIFGFEKVDNVCLVSEYATVGDFATYAGDFEKIRQTFKLK